jgi:hypothetical protein
MIFARLMRWWRARQRAIDVELLWPVCKSRAPDLDTARVAFAIHAFRDPAWRELGEAATRSFIDGLK